MNDQPLTSGEMAQILDQIRNLQSPIALNEFINGRSISITRDNPDDPLHLGKEISLKIYDRQEIALGQSRYQIVQQPKFKTKSPILNSRRGDLMLLINGMPVIHLELKRSGIPVSEAYNQIEKYSHEGVFRGIFYEGDLEIAMVPESFRVDVLKESLDANKVLVENANVETANFAIMFEFDGDVKKIRHCLYKCAASRPSIESQTNEDEIEVQTETLSLKATPLENGVVKSKTGDDTTDATYQNWYKAVYMPATEPETKAAASTSNSGK